MSISLEKRIETATVSLHKILTENPGLGEINAQVTLEVDFSGSMGPFYRAGVVQEVVERCLALSMTGLDDDGIVPVTFFDGQVYDSIEATESTYKGLVDDFMRGHSMGGTAFSGPLHRALSGGKKKLLGRAKDDPDAPPFLHIFVTDGVPNDRREAEKILVEARTRAHFFQFIFVGTDRDGLALLQKWNKDLKGKGIDNIGVTVYSDPANVTDDKFFPDVTREFFIDWLPEARKNGYTNK